MYCKEELPKTLWDRIRGLLGDSSSSLFLHISIFGGDRSVISLLTVGKIQLTVSQDIFWAAILKSFLNFLCGNLYITCFTLGSSVLVYSLDSRLVHFFLLRCMKYACISSESQALIITRVCLETWQALLSQHYMLKMSSIVQDSIDLFLGNYVVDTNEGISKPSPLETHRDWRFMAVSLFSVLCCNLYFFLQS